MDELDLYTALSQDRADFFLKVASFARDNPHLTAAALGAGIATGLKILHPKKYEEEGKYRRSAFKGALIGGGASIAREALAKSAGVKDYARAAIEAGKRLAQTHKHEIIGGLAGGAIGTGVGALSVKRWKKGKEPSAMESDAASLQLANRRARGELKAKGKKPGYRLKIDEAISRAYGDVAKAMAEHPVAGSLTWGSVGASLGAELAGMGRNL